MVFEQIFFAGKLPGYSVVIHKTVDFTHFYTIFDIYHTEIQICDKIDAKREGENNKRRGFMSVQGYPMLVSIYKGEGRILIIPVVDHIGGYSIDSSWFIRMENMQDYVGIGENLFRALDFVKNSPISRLTPKEREAEAAWKANSKYKSWVSFWKNNDFAFFKFFEDGNFQIYSIKRSEKKNGGYGDYIKMIDLPPAASAEEIGKAVIDVFKAAEEYYQKKFEDFALSCKM